VLTNKPSLNFFGCSLTHGCLGMGVSTMLVLKSIQAKSLISHALMAINFPCIISHLIANLVADLKIKTRCTPHGWSPAKSTKTVMEMYHNASCQAMINKVLLCIIQFNIMQYDHT